MRARLGICVLVAILVSTGCAAQGPDVEPDGATTSASTVAVQTRDIRSVLVVDGTVVARPTTALLAPEAGVVHLDGAVVGNRMRRGELVGKVGNASVMTPIDGALTSRLVADGVDVAKNIPVADITYGGFGIQMQVPADEAYRLYAGPTSAKTNIVGGPSGITCTTVPPAAPSSAPPADQGSQPAADGGANLNALCVLPFETTVVPGLAAKVGLNTGSRTDVLAVPLSSVSGRAGEGVVTVVRADKTTENRSIKLGMTDGTYIEVTAGLHAGDRVTSAAPGLE